MVWSSIFWLKELPLSGGCCQASSMPGEAREQHFYVHRGLKSLIVLVCKGLTSRVEKQQAHCINRIQDMCTNDIERILGSRLKAGRFLAR